MRYRALVIDLDDAEAPVEALRKIEILAKAGVPVILGARRPERSPGLSGQPAAARSCRSACPARARSSSYSAGQPKRRTSCRSSRPRAPSKSPAARPPSRGSACGRTARLPSKPRRPDASTWPARIFR
ncbi:MAG: hypothetical protein BWK77_08640, partial [Verrucomicrobia bacterium A1]